MFERCPRFGVELPAIEGPVHRYMESSPSCWAAYGQVLAREFSDRTYWSAHRLTVDAYAAPHPGWPSPEHKSRTGAILINAGGALRSTGV